MNSGVHRAAELLEAALNALRLRSTEERPSHAPKVGTMGPLTCSAEALVVFLCIERSGGTPVYFSSFQEVVAALLAGRIDEALVPHCHPIASELLFDPRIEIDMARAFDKPNPPLYLAAMPGTPFPPSGAASCAALPTLWPLVGRIDPATLQMLPVVSNPAAAKAVVEGRAPYAITNEASLSAFELQPIQQLKHVVVRWLPVRRSDLEGKAPQPVRPRGGSDPRGPTAGRPTHAPDDGERRLP